jgi:hypothetical protein
MRKKPGLAFRVRDISAAVPLKCFLGEPVEGQRGDRALKMRGGHAPATVRAAPAGEVVVFGPDHAFITHTSTLIARAFADSSSGAAGGTLAGSIHLSLTLVGVTLLSPKETHGFIIFDILRALHNGNDFVLGTNGVASADVRGDFCEVALRGIPIAPDLDPNFVVRHRDLLGWTHSIMHDYPRGSSWLAGNLRRLGADRSL